MISKNKGFIALSAALVLCPLIVSTLIGVSLPIFQYRATVDQKLQAINKWYKEKEIEDEKAFHFFK